ncbi:hypothetical protein BUALT_Bualt15G0121300 [Buddleja alternifolia]|uniref:50S ribosomal protein 6, chloroplastic n=1 Tax=Buddleja alternifolia TaxID=168488 RepID=A0AAV6WEI8_9LAMI|nr:hypothetical protein BUALT_Bualt15G0121300 [Buddleja alternifolia]
MWVSAIFGSRLVVPLPSTTAAAPPQRLGTGLVIECSSRPQKKATKHHMKTRPRKTRPSDIRRRPTSYPPLPLLPPDWTLVSSDDTSTAAEPQPLESDHFAFHDVNLLDAIDDLFESASRDPLI